MQAHAEGLTEQEAQLQVWTTSNTAVPYAGLCHVAAYCLQDAFIFGVSCWVDVQARAEELAEHEEQLEAWKQKFKAEALRQIGEREKTLADWQAKLDRKKTDLEEMQRSMEVRSSRLCVVPKTHSPSYATQLCCATSIVQLCCAAFIVQVYREAPVVQQPLL